MKILTCPVNGPRPISEFAYGGELRESPDPSTASDAEWADYVFNRTGISGVKREWWCHTPSGVWFIAERDTAADAVVSTYLYEQPGGQGPDGQRPDGQRLDGQGLDGQGLDGQGLDDSEIATGGAA